MNKKIKILAIESSCDETAAAVIAEDETGSPIVLSNVISSQIDLHAKTGGVVPEVASRAHMEAIIPVVAEALMESGKKQTASSQQSAEGQTANRKPQTANYQQAIALLADITHIAVTVGPGLVGSLLVGFNAAKTLACARGIPVIPINHIEGHIYSTIINTKQNLKNQSANDGQYPLLALTVSGGHTSLTLIKRHLEYENIGSTIDDAAGEAFDKVARLLGLGYPGGPIVSQKAAAFRNSGEESQIKFPRPIMNDETFNFSFSGLKTAVLTKVKSIQNDHELTSDDKEEISYAFEEAAVDVLCTKTIRAAHKYLPKGIILAGGVSANRRLQEEMQQRIEEYNSEANEESKMNFYLPPKEMMGDNAAMIGLAAYFRLKNGGAKNWDEIRVDSNIKL